MESDATIIGIFVASTFYTRIKVKTTLPFQSSMFESWVENLSYIRNTYVSSRQCAVLEAIACIYFKSKMLDS